MHTVEKPHGKFEHDPQPSTSFSDSSTTLVRLREKAAARYGLALVATLLAVAFTLPFPVDSRPFYFFVGATALSAWFGGSKPGLLTTCLNAVLAFWFVFEPLRRSSEAVSLTHYAGFLGVSAVVLALSASLQKKASALKKSQLHFGGVVQISEDAIMTIDDQQTITLFNAGAEKIFGYKAEEIIGKSVHVLLPERFRGSHSAHVQGFRDSRDALRPMNKRGTIYGRRQDGSEFPAEASISKFSANGSNIMTVRLRDITERVQSEQALRQMAAIVESSQDAIVSEDLNGVIRSWNSGAEKMYGYSAGEVLGRDARMLLPPGEADEVTAYIERARAGESTTYETTRSRKDGKRINVALTVSPVFDENSKAAGLSTIAKDITERRKLEQQLSHSQKMEAVGRLAGGVAHDFNNLLSVIVGYAYLMHSSAGDDTVHEAAEQIINASQKASSLTRQLLAFGGRQVMSPKVIDMGETISGLAKLIPRLVGEDIDVRVVDGKHLKHVKADPSQIEQVVMNLVVNARDAMPRGGKLTIETSNVYFDGDEAQHHGVQPGDYVMLAVTDTGEGMDDETRARIFEPFFTTKEPGKGTGLGLATVYGIVNQSNGHVWVYSELGHGTTFKIYLPATTAAADAGLRGHRHELTACGSETILLVEDQDELRKLLVRVLRDKGYTVLEASNGPEALRLVGQFEGEIDLLLTDVIMPEMRGQHLAEALSRRFPNLYVIYMSGYTDNALIHNGSLPEDMAFLQKPFTPDVVLRRVRQVLDDSASGDARDRRAG